ncbi:MAG: DUF3667 domain-containing protein [Gammaproteobacteria bacterium]|nr:DUF3667 domain-containing protein [Gammaproteobacteria bacterium]
MKPGQFELNFFNGQRIDFLRPITFFLLINVLFVIFSPLTDFYVTLLDQVTLQPYSGFVKDWLDFKLSAMNVSFEGFEDRYNQVVKLLARSTIIIQVPIFAVFAFIICYQRRYFFADYLVFSLNFHAWLLLWVVVLQPFAVGLASLIRLVAPAVNNWQVYLTLLPIGAMIYLLIAMNRFFQFRWWSTIIRLALIFAAYQVSHSIFRFVQFFITFYMVDVPLDSF